MNTGMSRITAGIHAHARRAGRMRSTMVTSNDVTGPQARFFFAGLLGGASFFFVFVFGVLALAVERVAPATPRAMLPYSKTTSSSLSEPPGRNHIETPM